MKRRLEWVGLFFKKPLGKFFMRNKKSINLVLIFNKASEVSSVYKKDITSTRV